MVGSRLGSYEVLSPLGAGGMGEVFRARDLKLGRDVALKILPEPFASDPERIARFRREAQVLASLNHPHIAAIYGFEEADGVRALVLELVEGETLADRIAQHGPVPVDEALAIARQIAEAVEAAHELGIIHRDLKPANIKVNPDGRVKVLDFGLAKLAEPPASATANPSTLSMSPTITTPAMTQMGMILGTAAYMSPEQAKGRPADKRSDVWAFGCVLYEMLTGKRAFEGEDVSDTLAAVLRGDPDWSRLPAAVPESIRELLRGALRKERSARIGDIAVATFLLNRPPVAAVIDAHPADGLKRRVIIAAAVGAVLLSSLAAVAVWAFAMRPAAPAKVVKLPMALPEGAVFNSIALRGLDVSPDGQQIVYAANGRLYLRRLDRWEPTTIEGAGENLGGSVYAPDGKSVAFYSVADQALKRIPAAGGAPLLLATVGDPPFGMSWSDGWLWVGQGSKGISRIPESSGPLEQVVTVSPDQQVATPSLLPGGEWLLFALAKAGRPSVWDSADIVVQSLTTKERRVVFRGGNNPRYVRSGHLLYAVEGTVFAVGFDLRTMMPTGAAVPVIAGVRRSPATAASQFSVSDAGTLAYFPGPARINSQSAAIMVASTTEPQKALPVPRGPYVHPRVAPVGNLVAFIKEEGGETDLWTYELTSANPPKKITFDGDTRFPVWTRDGTAIAVESEENGKRGIFLQTLTGSRRRVTTAGDGEVHVPESISRDGWLLFGVRKNDAFVLWKVKLDGSGLKAFDDVRSSNPLHAVFSPDDRWFAYSHTEQPGGAVTPDRGVYVQRFPNGTKMQVPRTGLDYHPTWAPDGKSLYYIPGATRLLMRVPFDPVAGSFGQPVEIPTLGRTGHLGDARRNYDVMPDGRLLLVVDSEGVGLGPSTSMQLVLNWFEELKRIVAAPAQ